jgi:putative glycosyltransferase (TIGR04348 family)
MVALHASKSFSSIKRFSEQHPEKVLIVTLTGTDIYRDYHLNDRCLQSIKMATGLIVFQPKILQEIPVQYRDKATVVYQSATPPPGIHKPRKRFFDVCVIGHLRSIKDPFQTARASRQLPDTSKIRVLHIGGALAPDFEQQAIAEQVSNHRYRWLGELPHWKTIRCLARSRLLVITSKAEGGPIVLVEALAASIPVLSTRIKAVVGHLGENYPGYFPVGDTNALVSLLQLAETDQGFYADLKKRSEKVKSLVDPARERESWKKLLKNLNTHRK